MSDSELDRMVILRDAIHNFYGADPNFPELIRHYNPDALGLEERLAEFSGLVKIWDPIIEGLDTNGLYPIIMRGKVKIQRDHKKDETLPTSFHSIGSFFLT